MLEHVGKKNPVNRLIERNASKASKFKRQSKSNPHKSHEAHQPIIHRTKQERAEFANLVNYGNPFGDNSPSIGTQLAFGLTGAALTAGIGCGTQVLQERQEARAEEAQAAQEAQTAAERAQQEAQDKKDLTKLLADAKISNITEGSSRYNDVLKKYQAIKVAKPNISSTELQTRINNYVKAMRYDDKENAFQAQITKDSLTVDFTKLSDADKTRLGLTDSKVDFTKLTDAQLQELIDAKALLASDTPVTTVEEFRNILNTSSSKAAIGLTTVQAAIDAGSLTQQTAAFRQLGKERLEKYDVNSDDEVTFQEFLQVEKEAFRGELTTEESSAIETAALAQFAALDIDGNQKLSTDEMAADLMTVAKINDTETSQSAGNITFNEFKASQEAKSLITLIANDKEKSPKFKELLGMKLADIKEEDLQTVGLTMEQFKLCQRYIATRKNMGEGFGIRVSNNFGL